ncbi:MAG TPA: hypothetical protein VHI93_05500 [Candidatus Thermoplasmatota archaeon]|nr:hypothetical protein [Candidatus Thermoplasmatota archaeon]
MPRPHPEDPPFASRAHSQVRELRARRNQLEVLMAALERRAPSAFRSMQVPDPAAQRARHEWELLREQLAAVEADLLRHEGGR